MASWYVRSSAAGAGTGANWANAFTTLAAAITASAAGDVFYVSEDHNENPAGATTYTFKGTAAAPNLIFCVNHLGSVPPVTADLRTTATIAPNSTNTLTIAGCVYGYGMGWGSNASTNAAIGLATAASGAQNQVWDSCKFSLLSTGQMAIGAFGTLVARSVRFLNTTFSTSNTANTIALMSCLFEWKNTPSALPGATLPTTLFNPSVGNGESAVITVDGVDLSAMGSGKTLVSSTAQFQVYNFINCKLGGSVTVAATPTSRDGAITSVINSDSSATGYRQERYAYEGTLTADTVDIRAGGASDGVTPIAWKVVTTANAAPAFPFECFEIAKWCGALGSPITVTIPIMSNATLTNADIWPEVEYLGSASFPVSSLASGRVGDLLPSTSATAWATDVTSSWTTTGVTGPVQQTLSATFTPQTAGYVRVKIKVAKASQTLRIDPLLQGF